MEIKPEEFRQLDNNVILLKEQVKNLQDEVKELVTKAEFAPVKMIAYGLATAALSSVFMAILAKVIIK